MKKILDVTPKWLVAGFVFFAVYLFIVTGLVTYALIEQKKSNDELAELAEVNRRLDIEFRARFCIQTHERTGEIEHAINITPSAIEQVTRDDPETDQVALQEFLDLIQTEVENTIKTPACDLDKSQRDLEAIERFKRREAEERQE